VAELLELINQKLILLGKKALLRLQKISLKIAHTIQNTIEDLTIILHQQPHKVSQISQQVKEKYSKLKELELPNMSKYSIKYSGPWGESSGYAASNRNFIEALHESGVKLTTEFQKYADNPTDYGYQYELASSLQNKYNDYRIKVLHITPNVYSRHKEVGKYHVGHMFWETTKMSPDWAWYLREVDEIWTGSEANKQTFANSGFKGPIFITPQAIDISPPTEPIAIQGIDKNDFVFYSIFQWIERKDPLGLLEGYFRAFEGQRDVVLVIKTYGLNFGGRWEEKIYEAIAELKEKLKLSNYPKVLVIDYLLSNAEMHALHESCDCFVMCSRFEGWHVPVAEALTHQKPVIGLPLGGIYEWLDDDEMYKLDYKMVNVEGMDWAEQYVVEGNKWGQVKIDSLVNMFRDVYNNQQKAKRVAKKGNKKAKKMFNFKAVGNALKGRIAEIYKENHW
jgi:hypothetical protein